MGNVYNVNEIGSLNLNANNNTNDNVSKYDRAKRVEILADSLLHKLKGKPESRPFMCKVAWKLSEAQIWNNVELASKGRNPMGLFIYLCKKDGV